ncbi:MAG: JAB domain-containing protein [Myxococcota bacterium]|nr:JAB domain-containing protein [Myxococcota bacterium]
MRIPDPTRALARLLDDPNAADRARRLVHRLGGIPNVITATESWLAQAGGLTPREAGRVRAAVCLSYTALTAPLPSPLTRPEVVVGLMASLAINDVEEGWVLTVDCGLRPLGRHLVGLGGRSACSLQPVDVLRMVVLDGASGFFLVHNHPSGDPRPSVADEVFTERLLQGAKLLNVSFHDHLILARSRWSSCLTGTQGTPFTVEPSEGL